VFLSPRDVVCDAGRNHRFVAFILPERSNVSVSVEVLGIRSRMGNS
jgi:hypothetical protein